MKDKLEQDEGAEERQLAEIIRHGGSRPQPPASVRAVVRAAAKAEWQTLVAGRSRRRTLRWAVAASVAVAGVAVWSVLPLVRAPAPLVASVMRVSGPVEHGAGAFARFAGLRPGRALIAGTRLRSGPGGRVALQMGGTAVRVDEDSALALIAPGRITLERGGLYVDADPAAGPSSPLLVETRFGTIEHLGTQYEARVTEGGMRVRVREGRVLLTGARGSAEGGAGEQVTLLDTGDLRREAVPRAGAAWAWVGEAAPPFDIESHTLSEFLHWASRETGRELRFTTPAAQEEAAHLVLRGSVASLTPERALAAVLATTRLEYSQNEGLLLIGFKAGERQ